MMDLLLPVNGQTLSFCSRASSKLSTSEAEVKPLQPAQLHQATISFRWDFSVHGDFWLLFFILRSSKVKHCKKISEVEPYHAKPLLV